MTDQPDSSTAPPAPGSAGAPDAEDPAHDAIPAHTDDDRPVDPQPADADRPAPRADQDPDDPDGGHHPDRVVADETVPDWDRLADDDARTPGQLLAALDATERSRDDYLESLQRKQAEFENFRKRMQVQGQAQRVAGHADVAGRILEVLDDFDRTIASIADDVDDPVLTGISLVRDKLMKALGEVGLERVDDRGAPFDPNRHEAVQQVPGDGIVEPGGEPVVAEVLRPGYVLGPRVLRAAMVAVAQ
jgi:molecular chaperone GrpE